MPAPSFLSTPLADSYSIARVDMSGSVEMDSSTTRRRPRFRSAPAVVSCAWLLTQAQYDAFDEWYEVDLVAGAGAFALKILGDAESTEDLGTDFGAQLTAREIDYVLAEEWATTAEDVLWRRTKCGLPMTPEQRDAVATYIAERR